MDGDIYNLFLAGADVAAMSVAALKQLIASAGLTLDGAPAWPECPVLQQLMRPLQRSARLLRAALWAYAAIPSRMHGGACSKSPIALHCLWPPRLHREGRPPAASEAGAACAGR